jgi:hypothetical protein
MAITRNAPGFLTARLISQNSQPQYLTFFGRQQETGFYMAEEM